ncbi:MAG: glucose-6-phosphate isomerase, partial [Thermodesulfobacteriota bacterium]
KGGHNIYLSDAVLEVPGLKHSLDNNDTSGAIKTLFESLEDDAYIAVLSYYSTFDGAVEAAQKDLQGRLMLKTGRAVQAGFGPRYLHSTGQIHKGGPNSGIYLIFTHSEADDLKIPGAAFTFSELELSQAYGDMEALMKRGRRVVLFEAASSSAAGYKEAVKIISEALA